jgi:hypothetical protein
MDIDSEVIFRGATGYVGTEELACKKGGSFHVPKTIHSDRDDTKGEPLAVRFHADAGDLMVFVTDDTKIKPRSFKGKRDCPYRTFLVKGQEVWSDLDDLPAKYRA